MNDDELERSIKTLVVEATRDTPRMTPEQVAARVAAERKAAMDAIYRRSPGLYEAVTEIARRFRLKQERRHLLRRLVRGVLVMLSIMLLFVAAGAIKALLN